MSDTPAAKTANSFLESLQAAARSLAKLEVVTSVTSLSLVPDKEDSTKIRYEPATEGESLYTRVDLIGGDVLTTIDPAYLVEERAWLRDYHDKQVKLAQDTVARNLQALTDASEKILRLIQGLSGVSKP